MALEIVAFEIFFFGAVALSFTLKYFGEFSALWAYTTIIVLFNFEEGKKNYKERCRYIKCMYIYLHREINRRRDTTIRIQRCLPKVGH